MAYEINPEYFKFYRSLLGFTNQGDVKTFFAGKDISPTIDYKYMELFNARLKELVEKINHLVIEEIKVFDISGFCDDHIINVFLKLKENEILPKLNNQGRRSEQVYFSWMRGYIISNYFIRALSSIFDMDAKNIEFIGDDDLTNIDTFKRTPKADLQLNVGNGTKLRIEVQSGFQGMNDIKQHKVLEAKRIYSEKGTHSLAIHFDLFNGQVAFVKLDSINNDSVNWITRQQMESQTVFNIEQNYFVWKLTEAPPKYTDLVFD